MLLEYNLCVLFTDVFHTQRSTSVKKKFGNKRNTKLPLYKKSPEKQKLKKVTRKSFAKLKKDHVDRTDSKTVHRGSDFRAGKRSFSFQANTGKRKRRKT